MSGTVDLRGCSRVRRLGAQLAVFLLALTICLVLSPVVQAVQVTLTWNANSEPTLAGYKVYYGRSSKDYPASVDVGKETSHTLTLADLDAGQSYYFAATAYDGDRAESDFSQEAIYTTPAPGPEAPAEGISAARVTIGVGGSNTQLFQYNLPLEPNADYQLSFTACSNTGHDLSVALLKHVSPYTNYGLDKTTVDLLTGWKTYTLSFKTLNFSAAVSDARLVFWFADYAAAGDEFWIDDVVLRKVSTTGNSVLNPGFENGSAPWVFYSNGQATMDAPSFEPPVPSNNAPLAFDGVLSARSATESSGTLEANDPDGAPLTFAVVAGPSKGAVKIIDSATGAYTYTARASRTGTDSFTFMVSDGELESNVATVVVTIKSGRNTVYEDAEDGSLVGWQRRGGESTSPPEPGISNIYDDKRKSRVVQLADSSGVYELLTKAGTEWHNTDELVMEWSIRSQGSYSVYVDVQTLEGHRYLEYQPIDQDGVDKGEYVVHGLGSRANDDNWHTFVRDLRLDLEAVEPGNEILEVNRFMVRGLVRIDDIRTYGDLTTVYEDAEDGAISGWTVWDASPYGAQITNVLDPERSSSVIQLEGNGLGNSYLLRRDGLELWRNRSQFIGQWSLKYDEDFHVMFRLHTSAGPRYLVYQSKDQGSSRSSSTVLVNLGDGMKDGKWRTFLRNLQADLNETQPDVKILAVNSLTIRGSGLVDDVMLR